jgi:prolyl 4-hydroxylase
MAHDLDDLLYRQQHGDPDAAQHIVALARQGDPRAAFECAVAALRGLGMPVDLDLARQWMERSAAAGHVEAQRALIYFRGLGIGSEADRAAAEAMLADLAPRDRLSAVQRAFLGHVHCLEKVATAPRETLHRDPDITIIRALFAPEECRYIQLVAGPSLEPAMIYTADGGRQRDPHRDSDNTALTPMTEDLVIQTVNQCIALASGTPVGHGEPLHVLRYGPGQQYRPHHDAYAFDDVDRRRQATALLYLNDDYEGGETHFPELGLTVRGHTGDLLIFRNLDGDRLPDPLALHAGLPITSGEKWLATRWIRCGDYFGR